MKDTRVDIYHGVTPIKVKPYEHNVKYYETDQMGIVHHSNYIRWMEEARMDLMDQMASAINRWKTRKLSVRCCRYSVNIRAWCDLGIPLSLKQPLQVTMESNSVSVIV